MAALRGTREGIEPCALRHFASRLLCYAASCRLATRDPLPNYPGNDGGNCCAECVKSSNTAPPAGSCGSPNTGDPRAPEPEPRRSWPHLQRGKRLHDLVRFGQKLDCGSLCPMDRSHQRRQSVLSRKLFVRYIASIPGSPLSDMVPTKKRRPLAQYAQDHREAQWGMRLSFLQMRASQQAIRCPFGAASDVNE